MQVRNVMVAPVISVSPSTTVQEVAKLLLEKRVSAVPVLDSEDRLVGIVSEGDLLHRIEAGTKRRRSWWLQAFTGNNTLAVEYIKAHARKVSDVLTRDVVNLPPRRHSTKLQTLMEKNAIKRVPVLENGRVIGIVSRANLLQAVASSHTMPEVSPSDQAIRERSFPV